jgi:hypothetical protein
MTDSTDTTSVAQRFSASLDLAAEADRAQKEEAERQRQIAEGRLLAFIDQSDLSIDDLRAIADFIARGCQVVTNDTLTQQVTDQQQEIVRLNAANETLQQQVVNLGGNHIIAFPDEAERDKAEGNLDQLRTPDGKLMEPSALEQIIITANRQPQPTQQQPQSPPRQGQGQQQSQRQQGNRQRGGNSQQGSSNRQRGGNSQQGQQSGDDQSEPNAVVRTWRRVTRPQPTSTS